MSRHERRLSLSFALALCVGVGYFGLLDALISVRAVPVVLTIPHVAYRPVVLAVADHSGIPSRGCRCIFEIREHFPAPRPAIPPLEIAPTFVEMHDERSAREVREYDPRDDASYFWM